MSSHTSTYQTHVVVVVVVDAPELQVEAEERRLQKPGPGRCSQGRSIVSLVYLAGRSVGLFVGLLVGLVVRLVGCLLIGRSVGRSVGWLVR